MTNTIASADQLTTEFYAVRFREDAENGLIESPYNGDDEPIEEMVAPDPATHVEDDIQDILDAIDMGCDWEDGVYLSTWR